MTDKILLEATELQQLMDRQQIHIVDTRSPEEYAQGHIANAVNIHDIFTYLSSSTPEGLGQLRQHFAQTFGQAGIRAEDRVVFYEQDMQSGYGQSCRGHFVFAYLGGVHSYVLHGGLAAWRRAGGEITDTVPTPKAQHFLLNEQGTQLVVNRQQVQQAIAEQAVTLLDVRDVEEWLGASSSPYGRDFAPRKGRLPGAKWIEWYRMMKPTAEGYRIKGPDEVRAECHSAGIPFDQPIWLYCFKGARTSNTYVALKQAGFNNVATYFGSWNEWSRDDTLPIESGLPWKSSNQHV